MLGVVVGTRPEIIKMAPIIWELDRRGIEYIFIHTGQHYDKNMSDIFLNQLNIREPDYYLECGGGSDGEQIARILIKFETLLTKVELDKIILEGDTNSVLGAAIITKKRKKQLYHVESGTRNYDLNQTEELNRVITDHISDILFAPTPNTQEILYNEGIERNRIFMCGNTLVETLEYSLNKISHMKNEYKQPYGILTLHRQENLMNNKMKILLALLTEIDMNFIFPIHPRTEKALMDLQLYDFFKNNLNITIIDPVGYFEFILLLHHSSLVITDSGGVVEEAAMLNKPVLVPRAYLEWIEIINSGHAVVVDLNEETIKKSIKFLDTFQIQDNPFPKMNTSKQIVDRLFL